MHIQIVSVPACLQRTKNSYTIL